MYIQIGTITGTFSNKKLSGKIGTITGTLSNIKSSGKIGPAITATLSKEHYQAKQEPKSSSKEHKYNNKEQ